jgi:hypothetical protein
MSSLFSILQTNIFSKAPINNEAYLALKTEMNRYEVIDRERAAVIVARVNALGHQFVESRDNPHVQVSNEIAIKCVMRLRHG